MKKVALMIVALLVCTSSWSQTVTTIAGSALLSGNGNGIGTSARFNEPHGIASDKNGNIFVADRLNNCIRKITPSGVVSTIAGTGVAGSNDGSGTVATFNEPWAVATDTLGNLYVADTKSYKIRKIDASNNVSTIAGTGVFGTTNGPVNVAKFGFSSGIAVTRDGSIIYVVDHNTHVIRKIEAGIVSNLAGTVYIAGSNNGPGATATFNHPYGVELDPSGNLIIADEWNNTVRKVTPTGTTTTFAGTGIIGGVDGATLAASFNYPWDMAVDSLGNIFIMDGYNFTVRKINAITGIVSTYVGNVGVSGASDGSGVNATFNNAAGITYNRADKCLYIADTKNHTIRKVSNASSIVINLATTSSSVCAGDSLHFTATPSGLTSYTILENGNVLGTFANNSAIAIPALSSGSHTLTCTAYDNTGAIASSNTVSVTVAASFSPAISSSNGNIICSGDSVLLSTQAGNSYLWSNGAVTQNVYVSTAGNYSVTVTNSNGCKGYSSAFNLTVQSAPNATITSANGNIVCPNDSLVLTASAASSYLWSNGAVTQSVNVPAGNYTVTVSSANGCTAKSSVFTITNYAVTQPSVSPNGTISIVQGDSVQLTATGGTSYTWSNGQTGASIYVSTAGNYYVTATSTNGCDVNSIPVIVTLVNGNTMISVTGSTSFCDGNSVILTSVFSSGNQWYYNNSPLPGETNQVLTASDAGYYKVAVWQGSNWINSDSILVTVYPAAQYPAVSDTNVCRNASVSIVANGSDIYKWYTDQTGNTLASSNNVLTISQVANPQTYYVEATNIYGCSTVDRLDVNIGLLQSPQLAFQPSTQASQGMFTTTFINTSVDADMYSWTFGDTANNTSTDANPVHIYASSGNYFITLYAENSLTGCVDTISRVINVIGNNNLFIPTTFTPNGDGKNDLVRVRGDHFTLEEMLIYDQWGKLLYRTDNSRPNWDGRVGGDVVQNGTYVYRIQIVNDNNISSVLTGSITVIK
jgi:gliding motility-associated-like protein